MANMLSWLLGQEEAPVDPWPFRAQDELKPYYPTPSEQVGNWIQDALMAGGAKAYPAGHVAHGVRDILSMSPLGIGMSAADLAHAKAAGDPAGAAAAAIGMIPGAKPEIAAVRQGIRAFHGSPHNFDRFDISKIGTGEGAQAYGHGLYFAESEKVAREYRDKLSAGSHSRAIDELFGNDTSGYPGRLYEVNINAKPEQFLDWDKSLQEQSGYINDKLKQVFDQSISGREAYQSLIRDRPNSGGGLTGAGIKLGATPEAASGRFNATGIPGIRYLDQDSRAAGKGTNNYVIFNDKIIDILKKYGIAGAFAPTVALPLSQGESWSPKE